MLIYAVHKHALYFLPETDFVSANCGKQMSINFWITCSFYKT